jgi:hypothetical protein
MNSNVASILKRNGVKTVLRSVTTPTYSPSGDDVESTSKDTAGLGYRSLSKFLLSQTYSPITKAIIIATFPKAPTVNDEINCGNGWEKVLAIRTVGNPTLYYLIEV